MKPQPLGWGFLCVRPANPILDSRDGPRYWTRSAQGRLPIPTTVLATGRSSRVGRLGAVYHRVSEGENSRGDSAGSWKLAFCEMRSRYFAAGNIGVESGYCARYLHITMCYKLYTTIALKPRADDDTIGLTVNDVIVIP